MLGTYPEFFLTDGRFFGTSLGPFNPLLLIYRTSSSPLDPDKYSGSFLEIRAHEGGIF
jgi:hypothetical protein